jgi:hypothetical protein
VRIQPQQFLSTSVPRETTSLELAQLAAPTSRSFLNVGELQWTSPRPSTILNVHEQGVNQQNASERDPSEQDVDEDDASKEDTGEEDAGEEERGAQRNDEADAREGEFGEENLSPPERTF